MSSSNLLTIGVAEFFRTPIELRSFKNSLPEDFFSRIVHSRFSEQRDILAPLNTWFSSVYFLSMAGLLLAWGLWPLIQFPNKSLIFPQPQWFYVLTIGCAAVLFNAAICGVLSTPAMLDALSNEDFVDPPISFVGRDYKTMGRVVAGKSGFKHTRCINTPCARFTINPSAAATGSNVPA